MRITLAEGEWYEPFGCYCLVSKVVETNARFVLAPGLYIRHPCGKREILVAKQKNFLKTTHLVLHELGHFLLDFFPIKSHKWYDVGYFRVMGLLRQNIRRIKC